MSIPTSKQADVFLESLRGSFTILLSHDTRARTRLGRFLFTCAKLHASEITVLDVDAFFCTNMGPLAQDGGPAPAGKLLLMAERDFEPESLLPLLSSKEKLLVIDDLNTLYSLASDLRKLHQLIIVLKLLSLNAKANGSWVVATAYRPKSLSQREAGSQRSLTAVGDILVEVVFQGSSLRLESKSLPGGRIEV